MFGLNRWSPIDEMFNFQREFDQFFNRFWSDLPARTANGRTSSWSSPFQVHTSDEGWRVDVPLPGVDPRNVNLEVAGNTLTIRAEHREDGQAEPFRFEQTMTVPQFLDIEKIAASHKHGMLQLTLPLKESVKPRRIQIDGISSDQKRIAA